MSNWKVTAGRVYVTSDNKFMVKNVGYKCWGLFINDNSDSWEFDWVGSTYPTAKSAMDSIKVSA